MNVFETHAKIVGDYARYIRSFINIADPAIQQTVDAALAKGKLWPEPLLQFNPAYEMAGSVAEIARTGALHGAITDIFRVTRSIAISSRQSSSASPPRTSL